MNEPRLTIYHDGSCPLCRLEIGHYKRQRGAERIRFVDVTDDTAELGAGLDRSRAKARFHARLRTGELRSGAAAFVEIWKVLPWWRGAALVTRLPGAMPALDVGYRLFSPVRPGLARLISKLGLA